MAGDDRLKVFISYSRDDIRFAEQVYAALDLMGFECLIDRHGIQGGQEWLKRLATLILEADTVVFVLSPASAKSKMCAWEVEEATRRSKRVLPIVCRSLDGSDPPQKLKDLNYVYFYEEPKVTGSGFGAGLVSLVGSLKSDFDWLREHTRLLERADEWASGGRQETALLFGASIAEAKRWAERRPKTAPEVTELHWEFIRASEEAEARRQDAEHQRLAAIAAAQEERTKAIADREAAQKREIESSRTLVRRTFIGLAAVSALALLAIGVGIYAYKKRDEAELQTLAAKTHLARAAQASSLYRATQSERALKDNDPVSAAFVALNGVPDLKSSEEFERTRPFFPEAFYALHQAWQQLREKAVLAGHTSVVRAAAVAPDSSFIVTISDDNTARMWDLDGKPLRVFSGHQSPLTGVDISRDSSMVVIASIDRTATVWDRAGQFKARLAGHKSSLTGALFSPDGTKVLTTSRDREARLWDLDGKTLAVFSGHTGAVTSGAFSPDGTRVLTASADNTAAIWDFDGHRLKVLEGHTGAVMRAIYSAATGTIATASEDKTARLWTSEGGPLATLASHGQGLTSIAFSPDGKSILTGAQDASANIWDIDDEAPNVLAGPQELQGHGQTVQWVGFSPDGAHCVTASADGKARVWTSDGTLTAVLGGHTSAVTWAGYAQGGATLLTVSDDATARIWDMSGSQAVTLGDRQGDAETPAAAAIYAGSGSDILVEHETGPAVLWNGDGRQVSQFTNPVMPADADTSGFADLSVAGNGSHVLARLEGGNVVVWDHAGAEVARLQNSEGEIEAAAISPDGSRVVAAGGGAAHVWDLKGNKLAALDGIAEDVTRFRFASGGARIAGVYSDGQVDVWSIEGRKLNSFGGGDSEENTIISPDGQVALLSIASKDEEGKRTLNIADFETGHIAEVPFDRIESAVFSHDARHLFAILPDGTAHLIEKTGRPAPGWKRALKGFGRASRFTPDGSRVLAVTKDGRAVLADLEGHTVLSIRDSDGDIDDALLTTDGTLIATRSGTAPVKLWHTFVNPQALVDTVKADLPRCLEGDAARDLELSPEAPAWCRNKTLDLTGKPAEVEISTAPPADTAPEADFAYYPPGDIVGPVGKRGRIGDRHVYLPNIIFPIRLAPGEHAYMNSQLFGYGGSGWTGKESLGGQQCDLRNFDSMRQRDTFCEVRSLKNTLCESGTGKQGQSIRPPTCQSGRWDVVSAADGVVILVSSNPTVRIRGSDGTTYEYLHLSPDSIRVRPNQKVKQGDVIGRVGSYMQGRPDMTTIQLNFNVRQNVKIGSETISAYMPVYTSLIAAYRKLKGHDPGIDANGDLIVDPDFEIGAGKIPRPPEDVPPPNP